MIIYKIILLPNSEPHFIDRKKRFWLTNQMLQERDTDTENSEPRHKHNLYRHIPPARLRQKGNKIIS